MNIRKLKKTEIDFSIKMSEFAFQLELSDEKRELRRTLIDPENTWVMEENDEIISKVTVLPFKTYIQGKEFSMGGVSGVVTWPEARRGGLVKTLLKKSLEEMKEKGQMISFLFPFSIPFYRKYGWEVFADKKQITMKREQLPQFKREKGYVRRVENNYDLLNKIYIQYASTFNGTLVRDKKWWEKMLFLNRKGQTAVYYTEEGEPTGYICYDIKERTMNIYELTYLCRDGWQSLWHFISNHDSMIDTIKYTTFANDQALFFMDYPLVEQKIEPYFMARIVDVKEFLNAYPFQLTDDDTLIFHLDDSFCPWNNGTFFVTKAGVKQFQPTTAGSACTHPPKRGITCSIQSLTTMLLNYQTPSTLYRFSQVTGTKEEVVKLEKAIPLKDPAFFDFF